MQTIAERVMLAKLGGPKIYFTCKLSPEDTSQYVDSIIYEFDGINPGHYYDLNSQSVFDSEYGELGWTCKQLENLLIHNIPLPYGSGMYIDEIFDDVPYEVMRWKL